MSKKILSAIIATAMTLSLISCSNSKKVDETKPSTTQTKTEEKAFIGDGEWTQDYSKDKVVSLNKEISDKIEELNRFYDLKYTKEEKVQDENGETINDNHIYTDNLNPEPNRLESLYYGFKMYGSDMASGDLSLKVGFKLDLNQIKSEKKFDLKEISISKFSEAMTGVEDRDYSDINNKIIDIVINKNSDGEFETNLNGLVETITIKGDFLLYKLETKKYNFKK